MAHAFRLLPLLIALLVLFWPSPGHAGPACTGSVTNVAFGSVNVLAGGTVDTTATWTVNCSSLPSGRTVCLSIDAGSGGSSGSSRLILNGANSLAYGLYQDAARSVPWGSVTSSGFGSPGSVVGSGSSVNASVPIYARLTLSSTVPPASYSSSFTGLQAYVYMLKGGFTDCSTGSVDGGLSDTPTPFNVSGTVSALCNLTVSPLSFGTKGLLSANSDASTSMSAQCTNTTPYSISLDNGQTGTAPAARKMTSGANAVTYGLYSDSSRSNVWSIPSPVGGTGTGASQTLTVYGRAPAQSTPPVGTYTDAVVVTLTY